MTVVLASYLISSTLLIYNFNNLKISQTLHFSLMKKSLNIPREKIITLNLLKLHENREKLIVVLYYEKFTKFDNFIY